MTARLTSGEPKITERVSFPALTPSGPKAVSGSSYMSCKSCCWPITLNRLLRPSTVAVDCFRPVEIAGRSAVTAASVCVGVSPNSRPSAVIASPSCALLRVSYKFGMFHTPSRTAHHFFDLVVPALLLETHPERSNTVLGVPRGCRRRLFSRHLRRPLLL